MLAPGHLPRRGQEQQGQLIIKARFHSIFLLVVPGKRTDQDIHMKKANILSITYLSLPH
jgi:hypothetical protein